MALKLLVFSLVILIVIQNGYCLQCFSESVLTSNKANVTCSAGQLCVTVNFKNGTLFLKDCGVALMCDVYDDCTTCEVDFCNKSTFVTSSVIALILSVAAVKIF
ncbi:hypothetical protein RN001_013392 [Aquatica leii]|uniref:Uncharacterized protein n=1 Tax=Aquatica leii TaxID=1421715 RepID=A0AAN7NZZ9_9COLE|nr:hypothetical protein RN001_013392 [Aquatica leii]